MCYAVGRGLALVRLAALMFALLGIGSCGGGGGDGGSQSGSKVFVADSGTDAIGSIDNPNPAPGNIRIDRIITGTSSNGITGTIPALFLDAARDQLYVTNQTTIFVFNNARFASGPIDYNRRVTSAGGGFNSISLDSARDYLYVGDQSAGVQVFHNASIANEPGAATNPPTRTISFAGIGTTLLVRDIALDPGRDILYVAVDSFVGPRSMSILVFDAASSLVGSVAPNRTITILTNVADTMGLFIDAAHDRLYFADSGGGVSIYETASIKTDPGVTPDKSIQLLSPIRRLTVDTVNDRLYAAGSTALYIVPNVSTVPAGLVTATAVVASPGSNFTAVAARP